MGTNRLVTCALAIASAGALASCGPTARESGPASAPPSPSTASTTTPGTSSTTWTPPVPRSTTLVKPNTILTTPPPARDEVIPRNAQDYGRAFVAAWARRDRARADQLATKSAVAAAFATGVDRAPAFRTCEGAAGSTYCTWEGDEYRVQVRIGNEIASRGERHAVDEVTFTH
jgi:hypothetical protein